MSDSPDNKTTGYEDEGPQFRWSDYPGWRWAFFNIIIWLMPLLIVFGIIFNLLCFVCIVLNPKTFPKLSRRNMLIVTGLDLFVLSVIGTFRYQLFWQDTMNNRVIKSFSSFQHDSEAACHFITYLGGFLMNGTPFFHIGLTIERVLAVKMPLKVKRIMNTKSHSVMLLVLFLLGSIAPALTSADQMYYYDRRKCDGKPIDNLWRIIDTIQYNVEFYMGKVAVFTILLVGCLVVSVTLWQQTKAAKHLLESSGGVDKSKRRKMIGSCAVMLFMNLVFLITQSPRAIFSVYEGYSSKNGTLTLTEADLDLWNYVLWAVMLLHNILDPFGYFIGGSFRTAFQKTMRSFIKNPFSRFSGRKE